MFPTVVFRKTLYIHNIFVWHSFRCNDLNFYDFSNFPSISFKAAFKFKFKFSSLLVFFCNIHVVSVADKVSSARYFVIFKCSSPILYILHDPVNKFKNVFCNLPDMYAFHFFLFQSLFLTSVCTRFDG